MCLKERNGKSLYRRNLADCSSKLAASRVLMDSDIHQRQQLQPQQQQLQPQLQQNMNSGLTRYRSAPSSYFSNLINSGTYEDEDVNAFLKPRVLSPETDRILSRFMTGSDNSSSRRHLDQIRGNGQQFMDSSKQEQMHFSYQSQSQQQQHVIYQNHAQSQQIVNNSNSVFSSSSSAMVDPLTAMNPPTNLLRQSSSPAGFFKHVNMDDGYSMMRSTDKFRHVNGSVPVSSFLSANRLKNRTVFSSSSHSSSRALSRIPENEGKSMADNNGGYVSSFPGGSWEETEMLSNNEFLKEYGESNQIMSSKNQNDEQRIHDLTGLTHQMSLPTSSDELSAIEKLLQLQDNVPISSSRAKRGCATHPRSIAERVRRTRISERMRRLQDLVPNMDKQTNTADMLDLAVDYIKELQNQVETLSDHRAKCPCAHKNTLAHI